MTALIDMFEARSLTNAINKVKVIEPFILNKLFTTKKSHVSDKIDIEITIGTDKLAQFVNPYEGPKPVKKMQKMVKTITLPRTFEYKPFTAQELADYNSINNIYPASAPERVAAANEMVLTELEELKTRVMNRREQMACEALSTGKVVVAQDNIDFSLDFEYVADQQLVTLTSTKKWGETTSKPLVDIRAWKRLIMKRCGVNADTLILGSEAADAFLENATVKQALDINNNRVGTIDLTQSATASGLYIGRILGIDIWEYNQQYTKADGTATDMIDPKRAIAVASKSTGFRLHSGPIFRIENGKLQVNSVDMLVESLTDDRRTTLEWSAEQKSLPTIHEPNAVISVQVV